MQAIRYVVQHYDKHIAEFNHTTHSTLKEFFIETKTNKNIYWRMPLATTVFEMIVMIIRYDDKKERILHLHTFAKQKQNFNCYI